MGRRIANSLASAAAAVALAGVAALAGAPADAAFYRGGGFGGFRGGYGGFHGRAMGVWRGGGWGRPGWGGRGGWARPGWGWGGRHRYGGYWNNGWWWGPALAGGLIVGGAYPYWGYYGYPDYGYDNGCFVYRRVYNRRHHYIGRMLVDICD